MSMGKGSNKEAAQARMDEQIRQAKIRMGTQNIDNTFAQNFTDDFYNNRRQSYLDYATPQVADQYEKAQKELAYALARSGTTDSSIRAAKEAELKSLYDTRSREIADQALSQETQARTSVEDARANLITMLNATGDAEGATNNALARAATLAKPEAYSPLGQLFTDFTATLSTQAARERAEAIAAGTYGRTGGGGTGLFGTSKNAVKVT